MNHKSNIHYEGLTDVSFVLTNSKISTPFFLILISVNIISIDYAVNSVYGQTSFSGVTSSIISESSCIAFVFLILPFSNSRFTLCQCRNSRAADNDYELLMHFS